MGNDGLPGLLNSDQVYPWSWISCTTAKTRSDNLECTQLIIYNRAAGTKY